MIAAVFNTRSLQAAESSFYTLSSKWEKSNIPSKSKCASVERSFADALSQQSQTVTALPTPPPLRMSLPDIVHGRGTFEIQQGQSLFLKCTAITKFIATDEGIVTIETAEADTIRIFGSQIGSTYIHVWDANGRSTFELRVTQPKFDFASLQRKQMEVLEKSRSFKFGYDNSRSATYTGPKFRDKARTSVDFTQNFSFTGDTPYGYSETHAQVQKYLGKNLLTDGQVALKDGRIGNFKNFNAAVGDSRVTPNLIIFPGGRIRGAEVEHWDDQKKVSWDAFYGKEQSSIIGTLTPGVVSKRTPNTKQGGAVMNLKLNDDANLKLGQFMASGRSRDDDLNNQGSGGLLETKLGSHVKTSNEVDFDNEHFASKHAVFVGFDKVKLRNEFRDVSKKFFTMLGAPSRQGEIGNLLDISIAPSDKFYGSGSLDIFRDRLIPNPENPDGVNIHQNLSFTYIPGEWTSLTLNYEDLDDTGRLGPTRQRGIGGQLNQKFNLLGHHATLFTKYQNRGNRILTNSLSNYVQNQVIMGLYTQLFWGINFSLQQEWNALKEPNINRFTRPKALTYSWDMNQQLGKTPFYMDRSEERRVGKECRR